MMIPFNIPPYVGKELDYMAQAALVNRKLCGDGPFTKKCSQLLEERTGSHKVLLTTSGSDALEMAAFLCGIKPGDEVIMPSFTFVSTANAFVLFGGVPVFVDIRPDTMNIDETKIEAAITPKTKAIAVVHYAGVACEMDTIMDIARRHNLLVVEDAAQGVMSTYKGRALGTIGDVGCYSFHETKNYSMGEGGAVLVQDPEKAKLAEIIREKGTNRTQFLRGQIDKYTWVEFGSSYLPSELNAAYLYAQLEVADQINENRLATWNYYYEQLRPLEQEGLLELYHVPAECGHNAHMFGVKLKDIEQRTEFMSYLKGEGVQCSFHYIPLHGAPAGKRFGRFHGADEYTTRESERWTRLPMFYNISQEDRETVVNAIYSYFGKKR